LGTLIATQIWGRWGADLCTPVEALSKITSLIPTTILITTSEFVNQKHAALHSNVVQYTRAGGTVLLWKILQYSQAP